MFVEEIFSNFVVHNFRTDTTICDEIGLFMLRGLAFLLRC